MIYFKDNRRSLYARYRQTESPTICFLALFPCENCITDGVEGVQYYSSRGYLHRVNWIMMVMRYRVLFRYSCLSACCTVL